MQNIETQLASREELAQLATQGVNAIHRLETIKGAVRELISQGALSEPPHYSGFALISARGFNHKEIVSSITWFPNETSAYAAIMLIAWKLKGALPTPDLVDEVKLITPEEFPLGTHHRICPLTAENFLWFKPKIRST